MIKLSSVELVSPSFELRCAESTCATCIIGLVDRVHLPAKQKTPARSYYRLERGQK